MLIAKVKKLALDAYQGPEKGKDLNKCVLIKEIIILQNDNLESVQNWPLFENKLA